LYHETYLLEGFAMHDLFFLGIVFLVLWSGHYAPWHVLPFLIDPHGQLHRPLAYAYGCLGIFLGMTLFALYYAPQVDVWHALRFLAFDVLAAGVGTMLPRVLHRLGEGEALAGDVQDLEELVGGPPESR